MPAPKSIEIGGKLYLWKDIVELRRQQRAAVKVEQPVLFPLHDDSRPAPETTAAGRYREPGLFTR